LKADSIGQHVTNGEPTGFVLWGESEAASLCFRLGGEKPAFFDQPIDPSYKLDVINWIHKVVVGTDLKKLEFS
jgi:hypothetical protein